MEKRLSSMARRMELKSFDLEVEIQQGFEFA